MVNRSKLVSAKKRFYETPLNTGNTIHFKFNGDKGALLAFSNIHQLNSVITFMINNYESTGEQVPAYTITQGNIKIEC